MRQEARAYTTEVAWLVGRLVVSRARSKLLVQPAEVTGSSFTKSLFSVSVTAQLSSVEVGGSY